MGDVSRQRILAALVALAIESNESHPMDINRFRPYSVVHIAKAFAQGSRTFTDFKGGHGGVPLFTTF